MDTPIKAIYIAGYGRSGTTLLDIALAQARGVIGCGEISALTRHVWQQDEYCACSNTIRNCEVWSEIVKAWLSGQEKGTLDAYRRAQFHHEMLFSPKRVLAALTRGRRDGFYYRQTDGLLRSISNATGCSTIVDSSKLPGRALALSQLPGVTLYVVHLIRDGRGVAWSLRKPHKLRVELGVQKELRPKMMHYTGLRWSLVNLVAERLKKAVGTDRYLRVRYEDFVNDPERVVRDVLQLAGIVQESEQFELPRELSPAHQMAGSRHRLQRSIKVRADHGWMTEMPASKQRGFAKLWGWFLGRYGYSREVRGPADLKEQM